MAQFRLLGAKFGLLRVTLNSGVYLGFPGLRLRLGDSGEFFSYLVLSFGNFEEYHGFLGSRFGYFWAHFGY